MFSIIFAIIIGIGLPIIFFIYAIRKKVLLPFILGMLAFVVSQVFLRIPILQYLGEHSSSYLFFSATQPILFAILVGLSAGVFEETARYIFMKTLLKKRNWQSGFLFGAGHGGIEAVLIFGVPVFISILSGHGEIAGSGLLIGGLERVFAILLHIGLSVIVLLSVIKKRWIYIFSAIFIHGFVDAMIGILPLFIKGNLLIIYLESIVAVTALIVFIFSLRKRRDIS